MKNNWKTVKIKDLGKVITGKTPPTINTSYFNGGFPFITPSDIKYFNVKYIDKIERSLSESWKINHSQYLLPKNSICYVCIGSTIGKMIVTQEKSFTNQQINSIIPGKIDNDYLFYKLRCKI